MSKWVVIIMVVLIGMVCSGTALALDGSGTEEDPWRIQSLEDFNDFAADANYWDDYTRLETDVNLAGQTYTKAVIAPDTSSSYGFQGNKFIGFFDGNDHKILNLTIDDGGAGNDCVGLFGYIDNGEVRNLGLEGGSVSVSGMVVGGLVGSIYGGAISNCYSTGDVNGGGIVGGLMGSFGYSSVSNCYSTGDVSGTGDNIGGLVGYAFGLVSNCYSTGNVSGDGTVGGLIGSNQAHISNCYSTGEVSGEYEVGGLVGGNYYGSFSNCFWDIETSGEPNMCGNENPTCDNSYGKTTAQMQTRSTFTDADWDFINVWNIGENQTYPYLRVYLAGDINKDGIVNFLDLSITANQWMEEK